MTEHGNSYHPSYEANLYTVCVQCSARIRHVLYVLLFYTDLIIVVKPFRLGGGSLCIKNNCSRDWLSKLILAMDPEMDLLKAIAHQTQHAMPSNTELKRDHHTGHCGCIDVKVLIYKY